MNIAIITARGGSKRIPRKNIRPFLGKPMIAWSIEAAKASGCFDRILVSTDDAEIAKISSDYGAEAPFLRPSSLADDYAHAYQAARHALEWAICEWGQVSAFAHIYPTAPMLSPEKLQECMGIIKKGTFKAAWIMTQIPYPIYQVMTLSDNGAIDRLFSVEKAQMRSQDMPQAVIDAGQAYCFETEYFLLHEMQLTNAVTAVIVPAETAIDIDTEEDWVQAEKMTTLMGLGCQQ